MTPAKVIKLLYEKIPGLKNHSASKVSFNEMAKRKIQHCNAKRNHSVINCNLNGKFFCSLLKEKLKLRYGRTSRSTNSSSVAR